MGGGGCHRQQWLATLCTLVASNRRWGKERGAPFWVQAAQVAEVCSGSLNVPFISWSPRLELPLKLISRIVRARATTLLGGFSQGRGGKMWGPKKNQVGVEGALNIALWGGATTPPPTSPPDHPIPPCTRVGGVTILDLSWGLLGWLASLGQSFKKNLIWQLTVLRI